MQNRPRPVVRGVFILGFIRCTYACAEQVAACSYKIHGRGCIILNNENVNDPYLFSSAGLQPCCFLLLLFALNVLYFFGASGVGENRQRRLRVLVRVFIAGVRKTNNGEKD